MNAVCQDCVEPDRAALGLTPADASSDLLLRPRRQSAAVYELGLVGHGHIEAYPESSRHAELGARISGQGISILISSPST